MSWLLDRVDAWLNRRDEDAVVEELLVADAEDAPPEDVRAAIDALSEDAGGRPAADLESEARLMIARSRTHERETDAEPSDSDDLGPPDWVPPERPDRLEPLASDPGRAD